MFFSIPRLLTGHPVNENNSDPATQVKKPRAIFLILLGGAIALVLALGLAGEPELEVAMKAALLLWLTQNAFVHLRVLIRDRRDRTRTTFSRTFPLTGLVLLTAGLVEINREKGYSRVYALKGGRKEWSRSKYPGENK